MAFSSGTFSLYSPGNPVVTGTTIASTWANNTLSDIASGLSTCVLKDGTQTITANIPMSSFKFTGLAAGSAAGDSIRYEQLGTAITIATEQASTSGTAITFTGIPAGVRRITVNLVGVSTNGTSALLLRVGSGSVDVTGYTSAAGQLASASQVVGAATTSFVLTNTIAATDTIGGSIILSLENASNNTWAAIGVLYLNNTATISSAVGTKAIAGAIDRVQITTNGGDTFDAGVINISYEGFS